MRGEEQERLFPNNGKKGKGKRMGLGGRGALRAPFEFLAGFKKQEFGGKEKRKKRAGRFRGKERERDVVKKRAIGPKGEGIKDGGGEKRKMGSCLRY